LMMQKRLILQFLRPIFWEYGGSNLKPWRPETDLCDVLSYLRVRNSYLGASFCGSRGPFLTFRGRYRTLEVKNGPLDVTFGTSGVHFRYLWRRKTNPPDMENGLSEMKFGPSRRSVSDLQGSEFEPPYSQKWDGGSKR
jgi:hypothetical protein